jgi:hypothetical protein
LHAPKVAPVAWAAPLRGYDRWTAKIAAMNGARSLLRCVQAHPAG